MLAIFIHQSTLCQRNLVPLPAKHKYLLKLAASHDDTLALFHKLLVYCFFFKKGNRTNAYGNAFFLVSLAVGSANADLFSCPFVPFVVTKILSSLCPFVFFVAKIFFLQSALICVICG
jgi:hypothetical protein